MKRRRRPVGKAKRRSASKAARPAPKALRKHSAAPLRKEVDRLKRALRQAAEQQAATSNVLGIVSKSTGELSPVFETILASAVRLCGASYGALWLSEEDAFRTAAFHGDLPPAYTHAEQWRVGALYRPPADIPIMQAARTRRPAQIPDLRATPGYRKGFALYVSAVDVAGILAVLAVPLLKENELIGAIVIYGKEAKRFTDEQIGLVQAFAAQAVIAIENTRLLNELRQRTDDLSESLEQQTATSEVLSVISSSPGDLEPVFRAMLQNACRICEAEFGNLLLHDEGAFRVAVAHGSSEWVEVRLRSPVIRPGSNDPLGRVASTGQLQHIADVRTEQVYGERFPPMVELADVAGARTLLLVPMRKETQLAGVIAVYRKEVRPFSEKQIELVQNFAAQAVIAIENTRLLKELRQRTDDLSESLEQQTATSDVLTVISSSPGDLQPVFDAMLSKAVRICEAKFGFLLLYANGLFTPVAQFDLPPAFAAFQRERGSFAALPGSVLDDLLKTRAVVHHLDDASEKVPGAAARLGGARSLIGVPLLKDGELIGTIGVYRQEVRPFSVKQIELVQNFAAQAVIAIENVRLFDEIQNKSRQLAEASQHKSQFLANMSHELRTPLNAILGYTELIIDGIYGETPERAREVLKRVESNGKHLLGLINDVLDLSKIEAGQLKLALADYSMKDVVHNVFSAVEPLATRKKLGFKVAMPRDMPAGRGDERKLTQVLLNLVGNAIKFTDAGEVGIKVAAANGSFSVAVHDTGPGIAAADQARLFQEFQQADSSITKAKGGAGLGLAISRRIIEMHGGRIWVDSSPGDGSTFTFLLPVTVEQQVEPP